jgi:translation elongation factor P/translation initiation factor 5A
MAVQASKSITLTDLASGKSFYLSAAQIISFTAITGSHTQLTYINNRNNVVVRNVSQAVATINTAAARTQAVTLNNATSTVIYIHSDKIIFIDDKTTYRQITFNASGDAPIIYTVTQTAAALNTAAGNTFIITMQSDASSRWINNLYVNSVISEPTSTNPIITFTTKVKTGSGVVTGNGTGGTATAASITFTGGGAAVQATGTVTVAGNVVTGITIVTQGSGYTSYPTITIVATAGAFTTTPTAVVSMLVESPLTIANPGANVTVAPTLTFSSGTTLATATATITPATATVTSTSLTAAGEYKKGTDAYPTLTLTGGAGCNILYDIQGTSNVPLQVAETPSQVQTAINAL